MTDVSQATIQKLFYEKIREMSMSRVDTFDYQFSDWLVSDDCLG